MEDSLKTKNRMTMYPAIPLPGIDLGKTIIQQKTCSPVFTAGLCTITKTWKQPRCLFTGEWIRKMQHIYTVEYYPAMKENKIMPFAATWMEQEMIILSKSERETNTL